MEALSIYKEPRKRWKIAHFPLDVWAKPAYLFVYWKKSSMATAAGFRTWGQWVSVCAKRKRKKSNQLCMGKAVSQSVSCFTCTYVTSQAQHFGPFFLSFFLLSSSTAQPSTDVRPSMHRQQTNNFFHLTLLTRKGLRIWKSKLKNMFLALLPVLCCSYTEVIPFTFFARKLFVTGWKCRYVPN